MNATELQAMGDTGFTPFYLGVLLIGVGIILIAIYFLQGSRYAK
jgi:hypothetical protein